MDLTNVFLPQSLNGSLQRGGYIVTGQLEGDTDGLQYGQNVQLRGLSGAGGLLDAAYRVIFDGHCLNIPDNLQFDKYSSRASLQTGTMDNLLKGHLQDLGMTSQVSPQNEHQITNMKISNIVEHILRRHCNAIYDASLTPEGVITALDINDTDSTPLQVRNVRKSNNLWQRLQELGGGESAGEFFRPWFNRHNKFFYQPVPAFWATPPAAVGALTAGHLRGQVRVRVNNSDPSTRIGQVQLLAKGSASAAEIFNAEYPANPGDGKPYQLSSGVWANSQARTDILAERLYKWLTRPYTLQVEVDPGLVFFGDDGAGLDLADAVNVIYDGPADNGGAGVHLVLNAAKFYVYEINVAFDLDGKAARATLTLEADNA